MKKPVKKTKSDPFSLLSTLTPLVGYSEKP